MHPRWNIVVTAAFTGGVLFAASAPNKAAPLKVKTDKGAVEGALTADGKVRAFKGIPFAAPPVGELRWKAPQPVTAWKGARDAKEFGSHCTQSVTYGDMVFHDPGPSEDCLTLNVWTPVDAAKGKLPVMVWIYGGGFAAGSTSEGRQDGQFLAHKDVVVVSMNYRMGIFGFLVHPELTAESPHHASGNYGLMDQAAAIDWVKRNIAAFGGDPANITIFGESAGSFSVSAQMASPLAKGLIAKAIGESGGAFFSGGLGFEPREAREKKDSEWAEKALKTTKIAEMRKMSPDDLLKATPKGRFGPDVDGYFLPDAIPAIFAAGQQAHVPVMAGWNADEGRGNAKTTVVKFAESAKKQFGDNADKFLAVYAGSTDEEAQKSAGDFAGDQFIAYSTWRWLEGHAQTGGAPVYRYFFTFASPGDKYHPVSAGAFHSDEIEYVFGALDSRAEAVWRPEDRKLSDQMMTYWSNFARTGDPNGDGLPKWPAYGDKDGWQVMELNASPEAKPDTLRGRYLFLDSVWGKPKS